MRIKYGVPGILRELVHLSDIGRGEPVIAALDTEHFTESTHLLPRLYLIHLAFADYPEEVGQNTATRAGLEPGLIKYRSIISVGFLHGIAFAANLLFVKLATDADSFVIFRKEFT